MTTFHFAFDDLTAFRKSLYCLVPSIVRVRVVDRVEAGLRDGLRERRDERREPLRRLRRGGREVGLAGAGLSQAPFADALALRNERSSRKKSSRFLPQRSVR